MKKFSISSQLLLLVFTIFLFISFMFIAISYFTISNIAENQVYNRLESYAIIIGADDNKDEDRPQEFSDMGISVIKKQNNEINYNDPSNFITNEEVEILMSEITKDKSMPPNHIFRGKYNSNDSNEDLYYVCYEENHFQNYTLILTDDTYIDSFVKSVLFRTFFAFLGIVFIAVAVIYGWSTRVTYRLKMIQNHIQDLPKSKYEKSYQDNSLDEIGELSRSVEKMRIEIGTNEKTKQEMLQNLSHDFKTPIAVIKSYAEAYQDGVSGPEALDVIINQTDILKHKVERLLQYNSLEYLSKDKPFENINMTELVKEVVSNYKYQTNLNINLDLEEDIIFLGYHENWNTIVDNILDNAKRYAKSEIKIILRENRLRIYNDGEHIDDQFLNGIFKPYEKGSKGQFGLGMSIVKKTVDFFGMNMKIQNEEYGGVSFIIENRNK